MKFLTLLFSLLASTQALAWDKIVSCDGDMLVIDRVENNVGTFNYQAVFRGKLVDAMIAQRLIREGDLNDKGELVRDSYADSGMLSEKPRIGFRLSNDYNAAGNYSVIFNNRDGLAGDYVFHSCWFRYPQR